jgi:hypothetical protein
VIITTTVLHAGDPSFDSKASCYEWIFLWFFTFSGEGGEMTLQNFS